LARKRARGRSQGLCVNAAEINHIPFPESAMPHARVNEIDLLRFIAALGVVFFHYAFRGYASDSLSVMPYPLLAPVAKYGYLGANLFFIISGFVILMTVEHGNLRSFLVSRAVRLYPAFWTCCTITFALIVLLGAPRFQATWHQYLVNMTMLSAFVGVDSIDGSYWSLFVEMKFYALVAVILAVRRIHQVQSILIGWLLLSILGELWPNKYYRYFLIVDYSAYFIAGATCFLIWSRGLSATRLGMLLLCWCFAVFQSTQVLDDMSKHYNTEMSQYVVGCLITGFFLVTLLISLKATGALGKMQWIVPGMLTYPLYLVHENTGFVIFNSLYPAVNAHVLLWATLGVMLATAYIVHVLIERRFAPPMKRTLSSLFDGTYRLMARWQSRLKLSR
jgi:peptidoglycan/LPS O-acetylase OafA/YrhL